MAGQEVKAYCYEDLESAVIAYKTFPQGERKEGEWSGFVEKEEKHWGTIGTLAKKFGVSRTVIERTIVDKDSMQIRDAVGVQNSAYCYEDLEPEVKVYSALLITNNEGEWAGFATDEQGNHWGTVQAICKMVNTPGVDRQTIQNLVVGKTDTKKIRYATGRAEAKEVTGYCWETIKPLIDKHLTIPAAEREGEWKSFYIDPEGNHWGTFHTIANKLKRDVDFIKNRIKELPSKEIRNSQGRLVTAYCYESIPKD